MAQSISSGAEGAFVNHEPRVASARASSPAYQAYQFLHVAFVLAPIIAGLDKFFHFLVNWDMYLAPAIARLSPIPPHDLMMVIGVVEIIAGLIVAFWPRVGAYIVALWLLAIIINLLMFPGYFDIALRDFGLLLCAIALGRLSEEFRPMAGGHV
jgi:hypothetical protein